MLFKLAFRNMRRSLKDYTIYFLTLLFGISIFYMFSTLSSQTVLDNLMKLSETVQSAENGDKLASAAFGSLEKTMDYVSAFVAVILGFLVVYANSFMIRRRKKEFGIYLTLGMSSMTISGILLFETILVGLVSLAAGIISGVLLSQLMSVFVVQMFGIETSGTTFVFSMQAMFKTMIYFGVMFILTLFVNMVSVSGSRLIRLLNADHRSKTLKIKSPVISIALFIFGVFLLVGDIIFTEIQYNRVGRSIEFLSYLAAMIPIIIVATVIIIVSLSGFLLSLLSVSRRVRYNGINVFVIKQLGSKLYSTFFSVTITTLILSLTLTVISAALSVTVAERAQMNKNYPMDLVIMRDQTLELHGGKEESVYDQMKEAGFDMSLLSEYEEFYVHTVSDVNGKLFYDEKDFKELKDSNKLDIYGGTENDSAPVTYEDNFSWTVSVIYLSDYNKLAKMYKLPSVELKNDEYAFMCNADGYKEIMQQHLSEGRKVTIAGKEYHPGYTSIIESNLFPVFIATNTGVVILPDNSVISTDPSAKDSGLSITTMLAANYDRSKKSAKEIDRMFNGGFDTSSSLDNIGSSTNEYYVYWENLRKSGTNAPNEDILALAEGLTPVYDSDGIIAFLKEDGTYWTANDDKTALVPYEGNIDKDELWQYNWQYECQYAYVEGYTEHVSDVGYPLAYEDADGKFYVCPMMSDTITPDGRIAQTVGKLVPMEEEWKPLSDYIYDRKDDCIYELMSDGSKRRIELSETEDFLLADDGSGMVVPSVYMYAAFSRITDVEIGLETSSCALFVALYIGMVFLLACVAVLGLRQLSDSADNKVRYTTLRQLGCSEKMINSAFFRQVVFFFLLPLIFALIISSVLLSYVVRMIAFYLIGSILIESIILTVVVLSAIYISFFVVTWLGCKRMIHDGAKPEQKN